LLFTSYSCFILSEEVLTMKSRKALQIGWYLWLDGFELHNIQVFQLQLDVDLGNLA